MRKSRALESGRDRKALARDAGLGRISVVSVLAGALSGYGALAALMAIVGLVAVAVNGGRDLSTMSGSQFKDFTVLAVVVASFLAFVFGGYTAGRMSRRSGATNGLMVGILGAVLGGAVVAVARAAGGGASLHRVALHLNVPSTWTDWRSVVIWGVVMTVVAIILGSLIGGSSGERWHAQLLARAADSSYGPEAERQAAAQKEAAQAEAAHTAAQERVGRATAVSSLPGRPTVVEPAATGGTRASTERAPKADARAATADARSAEADTAAAGTGGAGIKRNRHHLLHR